MQEEAHHWGQALRIKSLAPFPMCSLLEPDYGSRRGLLQLPILLLVISLPHHDGLLTPCEPQAKPCILEVASVMVFYHGNRKVRNTLKTTPGRSAHH